MPSREIGRSRTYRPTDGVLTAIKTGPTAGSTAIQNLSFDYDGNLTSRTGPTTETLTYDGLNRLTSSKQGAITYFDNGNIKKKADVTGTQAPADFTYDPAHPHAVASAFGYTLGYDANGNLISRTKTGESWSFRYAGFDKPRWMAKTIGSTTVGSEFLYNANRSRTVQLEFDQMSGGVPSRYVRKRVYGLGSTLEANYDNTAASGTPVWALKKVRIYVPGPDGIVGSREFDPAAPIGSQEKAFIYHYDHLGSIESVTPFVPAGSGLATDSTGKPGRFSEDAWGARRDPTDWSGKPTTTDDGGADSLTPRGFTGHEMLDDLGLIHMRGRIYDALLGRFDSADLFVQDPSNLQSYNRYSYVGNNPLSFTDPTGWFAVNLFGFTVTDEGDFSGKRIFNAVKSGDWGEVKAAFKDTANVRAQEAKENLRTVDRDMKTGGPIFVLVKDFGAAPVPGAGMIDALPSAAGTAVVATDTVTATANAIAGTAAVANMAKSDIKPGDGSKVDSQQAPNQPKQQETSGNGQNSNAQNQNGGSQPSAREQKAISKINNAVNDHMTDKDIAGAVADQSGSPIQKSTGGVWDHANEVGEAMRGVRKNAATLQNSSDPAAQAAVEKAKEALKRAEDALKGTGI